MQSQVRVRIPQITSIETALRLYYSRLELSSTDMKVLFGEISDTAVWKLKKKAKELMAERSTPVWNAGYVNTEVAYEAWGIDVLDLERRHEKLKKLEGKK